MADVLGVAATLRISGEKSREKNRTFRISAGPSSGGGGAAARSRALAREKQGGGVDLDISLSLKQRKEDEEEFECATFPRLWFHVSTPTFMALVKLAVNCSFSWLSSRCCRPLYLSCRRAAFGPQRSSSGIGNSFVSVRCFRERWNRCVRIGGRAGVDEPSRSSRSRHSSFWRINISSRNRYRKKFAGNQYGHGLFNTILRLLTPHKSCR